MSGRGAADQTPGRPLQRADGPATEMLRLRKVRTSGSRPLRGIRTGALQEAHMQCAEGARVPAVLHVEMTPRVQVVARPEPDVAAMEPLRANSGPAVDRGEVDQAD